MIDHQSRQIELSCHPRDDSDDVQSFNPQHWQTPVNAAGSNLTLNRSAPFSLAWQGVVRLRGVGFDHRFSFEKIPQPVLAPLATVSRALEAPEGSVHVALSTI